jgi:hypothetical protein
MYPTLHIVSALLPVRKVFGSLLGYRGNPKNYLLLWLVNGEGVNYLMALLDLI